MKEDLLLFIPIFNGYDKIILNELEKNYNVTFIDHAVYFNDFLNSIKIPFLRKHHQLLYKTIPAPIMKKIELKYSQKYFNLLDFPDNHFQKIFAIKADKVSSEIFNYLRKKNPDAEFLLYEWDDVKRLLKHDHFKYFDKIFSYNLDDCKKYNMKYLPMFTESYEDQITTKDCKYDVSMIFGYTKYKVELAKKIYEANKNNFSFYIYIYDKNHNTDFFSYKDPLQFKDYLKVVSQSRAIVEIPHKRQNAPTTRCLDVIQFKTKLISTNKNLKNYPFYNPENYYILTKDLIISKEFLENSFKETEYKFLLIADWLKELGL